MRRARGAPHFELTYFTKRATRAFLRFAVFFLMTPVLAALSIEANARESNAAFAVASAVFAFFSTDLTESFIAFVRRSLTIFLRADPRIAFFADCVIGIE